MLGTVHACIGAGVGSFTDSKSTAFIAGVISHAIADALPHRDVDPATDVPMIVGVLTGIACWKGLDSPEFWGALGGISPDFEHGLEILGVTSKDQKVFPTHIHDGKWHGDESGTERWSQLILSAVSLALVALNSRD